MSIAGLVKRLVKGSPLTAAEHDANLTAIENAIDARAAATHTHVIADVTGLQSALDGKQASGSYVTTSDSRLADAREWTASTVAQADAEAGTSTTRVAFTPLRVFQSIAAWWAVSAAKTKLDGIATGATANATDAQLRDRLTHTGEQAISTVTGLQTALDGKQAAGSYAATVHTHAIADVTGLQTALDGKAASSHTHTSAAITDFTTAVQAAAPATTNASLLTSGTLADARLSANVVLTGDSRLSDARTPTDGSVTDAKIASGGLAASSINWTAVAAWAPSTSYTKGALVHYLGITYRRSVAGTSGSTFSASNWQQMTAPVNVTVTPTQLSANANDYDPGIASGDIFRVSSNAARDITGFAAGLYDGHALLLRNVGSFAITLKHQSTSSTAANRIISPWAGDVVISANSSMVVIYDATLARWVVS